MTDEEIVSNQIIKYRNTIVRKIEGVLLGKFIDSPVEDFSEYQDGYEDGINDAIGILRGFIIEEKV